MNIFSQMSMNARRASTRVTRAHAASTLTAASDASVTRQNVNSVRLFYFFFVKRNKNSLSF